MVVPLGSVQPVFALPLLADIPDGEEDRPVEGVQLVCSLALSPHMILDVYLARDRPFGVARDCAGSCDILQLLQL